MVRPRFASESLSELVEFRVTPTQREYLREAAAAAKIGESELIRRALDAYFDQLELPRSESSGISSPVAGSKSVPASSTAKVRATSRGGDSGKKRTRRKHSSH
jgi:hypothetical protein